MGNPKAELVGQIFSRLTVISKCERKSGGKSVWLCICSCGNHTEAAVTHLTSGHTRSCGCLKKESDNSLGNKYDLTGERFGRLVVTGRDGLGKGKQRYKWTCRCDCGSVVRVMAANLRIGDTRSCGCLKDDVLLERNFKHGLSKTREYQRAKDSRRRKNARASLSHYTASDVAELIILQRNKCACCTKKLNGKYDVDHIVALARGGDNSRLNIQILCPRCNRRKSAKDPISFMQEHGYLI